MKRFVTIAWALTVLACFSCGELKPDLGADKTSSVANKRALTNPTTGRQVAPPSKPRAAAPPPTQAAALNEMLASMGIAPGTLGPNPKAAMLRPYFAKFLKTPVEGKVDPFRPHLAKFAPRVEIEEESAATTDEPKTPLEYFDVDSYKLVLIMSGTAQAKALVIDPKGKSYVVQTGTRIGNRGGKVVSITDTEVRIEEPGRPPKVKLLEPPVAEMERELQAVQEY